MFMFTSNHNTEALSTLEPRHPKRSRRSEKPQNTTRESSHAAGKTQRSRI